jgi:ABC-type transporter Mla subunit MlaD
VKVVRLLITLVVFVAIGAGIAFAVVRLSGGTPSGYLVRAIFDNSSFVTPGEQVKVAGVTVGTIHAVQLTSQNKSALVLQINNSKFESRCWASSSCNAPRPSRGQRGRLRRRR